MEDRGNPAPALRAAQDILDRAGYKSPEKVEMNTTVGRREEEILAAMSDEKLAKLKAATDTVHELLGA